MGYKDVEERKRKCREYHQIHKEEIHSRHALYRATHKEEMKAQRESVKDKIKERSAKYLEENRDEINKKAIEKYYLDVEYSRKKNRDLYHKHSEKYLAKDYEEKIALKQRLLDMYGGICACCGESDFDSLTLDHVNNDGAKHGKSRQHREYYRALKEYNPIEFQILCINCNESKLRNKGVCWHVDNIDRRSEKTKHEWERVYEKYGDKCIKCGESNPTAIQVDHIYNDRNGTRTNFGYCVSHYDPLKYQILCACCNKKKYWRTLHQPFCMHA